MSNIDEKAKNNFTIEVRIFENHEYEIIKVIDFPPIRNISHREMGF